LSCKPYTLTLIFEGPLSCKPYTLTLIFAEPWSSSWRWNSWTGKRKLREQTPSR
jgi:hypothetical protein